MPKVQKKGQIGHFWHDHLQSTIKHSSVIIMYTHSTLFLFFPLDYKHVKSEQAKCDFSSGSFFVFGRRFEKCQPKLEFLR